MRIVIPSRGRADRIGRNTLRLLPEATVCVDEAEVEDYLRVTRNVWPHPPLRSLGAIRNWIIDNVDDELVIQVDDDIVGVASMVGQRTRKYSRPREVLQIIENAAECARGIGAGAFGFNLIANPKMFSPFEPIQFTRFVGGCIGIFGKEVHYDETLSMHDDVDFSLSQMLVKRIVYRDDRFLFYGDESTDSHLGGNTIFGSRAAEERELATLRRKWGKYVRAYRGEDSRSSTICIPVVARRQ